MNKWGKSFWIDLGERALATALGGLLAVLTLTSQTPIDWGDGTVVWTVLGVPVAVSIIKGLLANLPGTVPSSSLAGVSSTTKADHSLR